MGDNKTNLIINYLPQTLTDEEFRSMFLSIGPIKSAKIVRDKATSYSYGFGFVDYEHEQDAQRAIDTLNGLQLQNKHIKVALSRPGGEVIKGANIYIRNLPKHYTEKEVIDLFCNYGNIVQARVLTDPQTNESKTVGFVLYDKKHEAELALKELNNKTPPGGALPLLLKFADDNSKKVRPPASNMSYYPPRYPQDIYHQIGAPRFPGGPMRNSGSNRFRYNPMAASHNQQGMGGQSNSDGQNILFVYNIGYDTTEKELWSLFSTYGTVLKCNVIWDSQKGQGKGYGFVTMSMWQEGMNAIQELNGYHFKNGPITVSFKK
ncbi:hypothetical protein CHS0354_016887 [Potamilus streckersoni]|uniref:RRM domain-containing protein n=1 Tax=Potamilus streckersoni TaxID=2493646 RepID=A0AAE0VRD2_9BIVA|nr:hypothetical protein CHS0354_016887 [Potamilus streckersoni]